MRKIDMLEGFELEIGMLDNNITKPKTTDSEYWINSGIAKFYKTRYSGMNVKQTGFEQTQKRIDDLRTLVKKEVFTFTLYPKMYTITLPTDYVLTLGETVGIFSNDKCWPVDSDGITKSTKYTDVLEATIENFDRERENSLSEYRLHNNRARPLRLYHGNHVQLFTDDDYHIREYELTYLRQPEKFSLESNVFDEYTDLPAHTHQEIVKMAAQLYIENIGDVNRYQTYSNEVHSME